MIKQMYTKFQGGVENIEKNYWTPKMAKNTCDTSKLQANRLHEALLDHHKKHTFFRLFQYLFC